MSLLLPLSTVKFTASDPFSRFNSIGPGPDIDPKIPGPYILAFVKSELFTIFIVCTLLSPSGSEYRSLVPTSITLSVIFE